MKARRRIDVAAPAKINLSLTVIGRRGDGYHLLESLVAFADIHDTVICEPADVLSLDNRGPFGAGLPGGGDNLVWRAAERLMVAAGVETGAGLTLIKRLPPASGIGGGSADAAATLRAVCELYALDRNAMDLPELAVSLGADVPVCLGGRAAVMRGTGEEIAPLEAFPETPIVLVNPLVEVSTPAVFKARRGDFSQPLDYPAGFDDADAVVRFLADGTANDLMEPAIETTPVIADVLAAVAGTNGCKLARMSGSGATCFGLFAEAGTAAAAAEGLRQACPDWWVAAGKLLGDARDLAAQP